MTRIAPTRVTTRITRRLKNEKGKGEDTGDARQRGGTAIMIGRSSGRIRIDQLLAIRFSLFLVV